MLAFAVAPPLSQPGASACIAPHDHYPFCDQSKPLDDRVSDLISRIREEDVPNLLTARGRVEARQRARRRDRRVVSDPHLRLRRRRI